MRLHFFEIKKLEKVDFVRSVQIAVIGNCSVRVWRIAARVTLEKGLKFYFKSYEKWPIFHDHQIVTRFHQIFFYLRARYRAVACYRDPSSYYFYSRDGGAGHGGVAVVALRFWMKEEVDIAQFEPLRRDVSHRTGKRWRNWPLKLIDKTRFKKP